jgi:hypothetical protein
MAHRREQYSEYFNITVQSGLSVQQRKHILADLKKLPDTVEASFRDAKNRDVDASADTNVIAVDSYDTLMTEAVKIPGVIKVERDFYRLG